MSLSFHRGPLAALAFLLAAGSVHALDFRLHTTRVQEDGFAHEQVYFQYDAATRVVIAPPAGWLRMDDAGSLTLTPPKITNGMVKVEHSSLTPNIPFQAASLETYRKRVFAMIPQGAAGVKLDADAVDPLPVFGWKSFEFTVNYDFFGQSYRRSVLFLNLNAREQIMVTAVALQQDFDGVHTAAMDLMRSWQAEPFTE